MKSKGLMWVALVLALCGNAVLGRLLYKAHSAPLPAINSETGMPDLRSGILVHAGEDLHFVGAPGSVSLARLDAQCFGGGGSRYAHAFASCFAPDSEGWNDAGVIHVSYDKLKQVEGIRIPLGSEIWIARKRETIPPSWLSGERHGYALFDFTPRARSFLFPLHAFGVEPLRVIGANVSFESFDRMGGGGFDTYILKPEPDLFDSFVTLVNEERARCQKEALHFWKGGRDQPPDAIGFGPNSVFDEWDYDDGEVLGYDPDSGLVYFEQFDD